MSPQVMAPENRPTHAAHVFVPSSSARMRTGEKRGGRKLASGAHPRHSPQLTCLYCACTDAPPCPEGRWGVGSCGPPPTLQPRIPVNPTAPLAMPAALRSPASAGLDSTYENKLTRASPARTATGRRLAVGAGVVHSLCSTSSASGVCAFR